MSALLTALAASAGFALPYHGAGIEVVPYDDWRVCGRTATGKKAGGCWSSDEPMLIRCHKPACGDEWLLHHELGHVLDYQVLSEHDRDVWARAYGGRYHIERFAETYASCQTNTTADGEYHNARLIPWSRRGRRICDLMRVWTARTLPAPCNQWRLWRQCLTKETS